MTVKKSMRWFAACALAIVAHGAQGAKVEIAFPLGRTAYQTNEEIHLAILRSGEGPLPGGLLRLAVAGADGSRLTFALAAAPVKAIGADARATEHVRLNGRLLRPGHYTVEAAVDGATATAEVDVYSHLRRSSFKLIPWGRAKGDQQLVEGEDSLGFNLFYGVYGLDTEANLIRAGVDFMRCCAMGGAHQMDIRSECDWSDPYVTRGGVVRAAQRAFVDRTRGNVAGVHFYDEPGLTHLKHPVTGEFTPHGIPSQVRAYRAAFGRDPLPYHQVNPNDPEHVARWRHWAYWKLGFMDAAWKISQFGVRYVRPDFLSTTQSQYGWTAFTDGYYFNVARCMPVVSGHGGYHDYGLMLFNPSYMLEMARARDLARPCWYLPCWYSSTTSEQFRLEQYLSFQTGIQGLQTPPDIDPFEPAKKLAAEGVVESNKLAARLGTIFTTMRPTRPPLAVLYSMSHLVHVQTRDRTMNYAHADDHVRTLQFVYLACKTLQQPFHAVVDEDVLDGTLAAHHKAVVLADVDWLDPKVAAGLEAFIADGGRVLLAGNCQVTLKGAIDLGVRPKLGGEAEGARLREQTDQLRKQLDPLQQQQKKERDNQALAGQIKALQQRMSELNDQSRMLTSLGRQLQAVRPLAEALRKQLAAAEIAPAFECDKPGVAATRHAAGDVEYLFAVNASIDPEGPPLNTRAAEATISLPADGRAVYDAVHGGPVPQLKAADGKLSGRFRFGPGQMRVFARTARPVRGVRAARPVLRRDYTVTDAPLVLEVAAAVIGDDGGVLSGSVPLRLRLIDPLGVVRYDLYRATELGTVRLSLPLAVNDPAGEWTLSARELLANTEHRVPFALPAVSRCGALAGLKERAVHFGRDRDNVFRFFRVHRRVTIVTGKSDYNRPAAERLAEVLRPWDVQCTIVPAEEVNKPRQLPAEAVKTWCGLVPSRLSEANPGRPEQVGFAIESDAVLLGTPEDNPLIAYLKKHGFLPYEPKAGAFPGRGRGMIAWQRDGIGHGQESIALIAYDAAGMDEAVGTLYEAQSGMEPLMQWDPPRVNRVTPADQADLPPAPAVAWDIILPDRAVAMKAEGGKLTVLTRDESVTTIAADGKAAAPKPLDAAAYARACEQMKPAPAAAALKLAGDHPVIGRIPKHAAARGKLTAVGYWGGLLRVLDAEGKPEAAHQFQHDITGMVWLGDVLAVGLSDGRVVGVKLD